jgi:hypothetical protein
VPKKEGGVSEFDDNTAWFEELANYGLKSSKILNGHIYALGSLWAYWRSTGNENSKYLIDLGISAVKKHLASFDKGYISMYCLHPEHKYALIDFYHSSHIKQLLWLYEITRDIYFLKYALRFSSYEISTSYKVKASCNTNTINNLGWTNNLVWICDQFPAWIIYDLNEIREIVGISIIRAIDEEYPESYRIFLSKNDYDWGKPIELRDFSRLNITKIFNHTKARYLKIEIDGEEDDIVRLSKIGVIFGKDVKTAVSDSDNYITTNKPLQIFNDYWQILKSGWLLLDFGEEGKKGLTFEVKTSNNVNEIHFFVSSSLEEFTKPKMGISTTPETNTTRFMFRDIYQRFLKIRFKINNSMSSIKLIEFSEN